MTTDLLTPTAPTATRTRRWEALTGQDTALVHYAALDAAKGYADGRYSSGYEAGQHHDSMLPDGSASTDQRVRAWGDYLIDLGDYLLAAAAKPAPPTVQKPVVGDLRYVVRPGYDLVANQRAEGLEPIASLLRLVPTALGSWDQAEISLRRNGTPQVYLRASGRDGADWSVRVTIGIEDVADLTRGLCPPPGEGVARVGVDVQVRGNYLTVGPVDGQVQGTAQLRTLSNQVGRAHIVAAAAAELPPYTLGQVNAAATKWCYRLRQGVGA